jgi:hypothetical protein
VGWKAALKRPLLGRLKPLGVMDMVNHADEHGTSCGFAVRSQRDYTGAGR